MTNTEPLDLDAIEARANAATEGPWMRTYPHVIEGFEGNQYSVVVDDDPDETPGVIRPEDSAFIAHAREDVPALLAEVRRLRDEGVDLRENPRDEYHSMDEIYDYRMLYNALAFNAWSEHGTHPVVKSWRHSDGELCFGGGWFIVTATLPTGLVSNHYKAEHWDLFRVPEATPPAYDGHTPAIAAERMRELLLTDPKGNR